MTEIQGDLLEIKKGIIFHQVNISGVTGGLAGALRRKWPGAFNTYIKACELPWAAILGTACPGRADNGLWLMHVFGQDDPGPNTDMEAVRDGLEDAARRTSRSLSFVGQPTYFPYKMGCGLGGGNWDEYRSVIEKHFPDAIIVRKSGYD